MNRLRSCWIIVSALLYGGLVGVCHSAEHRLGAQAEAGVFMLTGRDGSGGSVHSLGADGAIGFDYQFVHRHFVLATGLGAFAGGTAFRVEDRTANIPNAVDKDGYVFNYQYRFSRRKDRYTPVGLRLPMMAGVEIGAYQIMAGCSFAWYAYGKTDIRCNVETWGEYKEFIDPFTGMPEHQFYADQRISRQDRYLLKPDIRVCFEASRLIKPASQSRTARFFYSIGIYAEYGVTDILRGGKASLVSAPTTFKDSPSMLTDIALNHYLSTEQMHTGALHSLRAGVRLHIFFPVAKQERCVCLLW